MYNHIIDKLVGTGLAVKLDEHVWMDLDCDTCTEEEAFGVQNAPYAVVRPDLCFCGDKVEGTNISMKGDGYNGGEIVLTEKGTIRQRKTSTKKRKLTMIGLTNFSGEPVMCLLILEGKLLNGA